MTGAAPALSVVLVDDHRLFRESLRALLDVHEGIEVVAEGANGEEAVRLARQHRPDVVLLDVEMPGQSVLTSLVEIHSASPATRIVVLTMHENTTLARQLLKDYKPAPDMFPSEHLLRLRAAAEEKFADKLAGIPRT